MLQMLLLPLLICLPFLVIAFWQVGSLVRFFQPIVCPSCQQSFPVPTRLMPTEEAQKLIGTHGYRCPHCHSECDYRGQLIN